MQEKRSPVFVAATANDPTVLPGEFLRQGRFDETFFVGLPGPMERKSAWTVHLRKRGRQPGAYDLQRLVAASDLFSGAEIEQTVIAGLFRAFTEGHELSNAHLTAAAAEVYPLARAQERRIAAITSWGAQNARQASKA
jgi:SpoVK/Ycf46/Vps4 family AAA+-type ATPase